MQDELKGINAYRFVEQWFIPFPPEEVWDVVASGKRLPEWWKGVYLKAEPLEDYTELRVGAKLRVEMTPENGGTRWTTPRGEAGLTAYLLSRQEAKSAVAKSSPA